ncbi:hypothetical protein VTL71DRAFT_3481 [Oculimacula yallundae]|uniref:NAD-dependent protein deacetylase n=1 Tax=Oculimacula yallundae TaxID=86028 RepID=A0ABR4C8F8_9HELO
MGQENSQVMDPNAPPYTLSSRSIAAVADFIKDGPPKRIVVMTGAGISTSAGIPDFRSPETGLYSNLARLDLPHPEAVFDISFFREKPEPFYVLAKELYPGKFHPTIAHSFIALLHRKHMLYKLFTQNIDCLERKAGVPDDKVVEAHGSFATQRCIECKTSYPDDLMKKAVESANVPHCEVPECNGLVKPDIVFFGEPLPSSFFDNRDAPQLADVCIVIGTSLSVQPFAHLPSLASEGTPRILISREQVGDLGNRPDDVMILGDCDDGVRKLADALGWTKELEDLWYETTGKFKEKEAAIVDEQQRGFTKDELLEAEIEKITADVDSTLKLTKDHMEWANKGLDKAESKGISSISSAPVEKPINTEKVENEKPAEEPKIDTQAILDATLPQHKPSDEPSKSHI